MIKQIGIFIFIIMLAGCGFKLQGKHQLPTYMNKLVISAENSNDPFQVMLRDVLKNNGVLLVSNQFIKSNNKKGTKQDASLLDINTPTISQQIHGYDSKGQVSQYRLVATCSYKLFDHDGKVLRQNIINRSRTYGLSPNQLLSNDSEQQIIAEELNMEIINELLRQLSSDINNINSNQNKTIEQDDPNCPC